MVRRDTLVKVDKGDHGGLWVASTSHGAFSWPIGMLGPLYPISLENVPSGDLFSSLLKQVADADQREQPLQWGRDLSVTET